MALEPANPGALPQAKIERAPLALKIRLLKVRLPPHSIALQIARLVEHKIRQPTAAIANKSPRPGIDEIGEENAVARFHFRPNRVGRMPGVVGYGKGVATIWRKRHLCLLWFASVRQHLVKDRADVRRGIVRRQIKLYGDPFPKTVGMLEDTVAGNVARQDRN